MDEDQNQKCPKCGAKPKYIGGKNEDLIFFCPICNQEFIVKDGGFGYLPMREAIRREAYQ